MDEDREFEFALQLSREQAEHEAARLAALERDPPSPVATDATDAVARGADASAAARDAADFDLARELSEFAEAEAVAARAELEEREAQELAAALRASEAAAIDRGALVPSETAASAVDAASAAAVTAGYPAPASPVAPAVPAERDAWAGAIDDSEFYHDEDDGDSFDDDADAAVHASLLTASSDTAARTGATHQPSAGAGGRPPAHGLGGTVPLARKERRVRKRVARTSRFTAAAERAAREAEDAELRRALRESALAVGVTPPRSGSATPHSRARDDASRRASPGGGGGGSGGPPASAAAAQALTHAFADDDESWDTRRARWEAALDSPVPPGHFREWLEFDGAVYARVDAFLRRKGKNGLPPSCRALALPLDAAAAAAGTRVLVITAPNEYVMEFAVDAVTALLASAHVELEQFDEEWWLTQLQGDGDDFGDDYGDGGGRGGNAWNDNSMPPLPRASTPVAASPRVRVPSPAVAAAAWPPPRGGGDGGGGGGGGLLHPLPRPAPPSPPRAVAGGSARAPIVSGGGGGGGGGDRRGIFGDAPLSAGSGGAGGGGWGGGRGGGRGGGEMRGRVLPLPLPPPPPPPPMQPPTPPPPPSLPPHHVPFAYSGGGARHSAAAEGGGALPPVGLAVEGRSKHPRDGGGGGGGGGHMTRFRWQPPYPMPPFDGLVEPSTARHVFVDESNVFISSLFDPATGETDYSYRLDVGALARLLERGVGGGGGSGGASFAPAVTRFVAGSDSVRTRGVWERWREAGFVVEALPRDAQNREVAVDTVLHAAVQAALAGARMHRDPAGRHTIVLATGDGGSHNHTNFPSLVFQAALEGVRVECWAFAHSRSRNFEAVAACFPDGRVTLHDLVPLRRRLALARAPGVVELGEQAAPSERRLVDIAWPEVGVLGHGAGRGGGAGAGGSIARGGRGGGGYVGGGVRSSSAVAASLAPPGRGADRYSGAVADGDADGDACVVCLVRPRDSLILPCSHLVVCHDHSPAALGGTCPTCGGAIGAIERLLY